MINFKYIVDAPLRTIASKEKPLPLKVISGFAIFVLSILSFGYYAYHTYDFFAQRKLSKIAPTKKGPVQNIFDHTLDDKWSPIADDPTKKVSQAELNNALRGKKSPFTFHEEQKQGLCGKHAINNAFGEEVEKEQSFIKKVVERTGLEMTADDFGTDPQILREILHAGEKKAQTKLSKISDLPGFSQSKAKAIHDFLGNAKWFIAFNPLHQSFPIPSKSKVSYPIAAGHIFAARKDEEGQWWIIDSRNPFMLDIPLTLLSKEFVLIVPV